MKLFDRDSWYEVGKTLGRNKRRTFVTAFGVFWGIFMLIILLGISQGFSNGIYQLTQSIASNMIFVTNGTTSKPYAGLRAGRDWSIKHADMALIADRVPEVSQVVGAIQLWRSEDNVSFEGKRTSSNFVGITRGYLSVNKVKLLHGRLLTDIDHREARKYCLMGIDIANDLFRNPQDAVGKIIHAEKQYYTVVGVITQMGAVNIGVTPSYAIYLPYEVLNVAANYQNKIDFLSILPYADALEQEVLKGVKEVLRGQYQIAPDDESAISHFSASEIFNIFRGVNLGISVLVWIVGLGTLFSGIVGISNILLVTVRERTQEIGVRRALGAQPRDIVAQLMMESLTLTSLAGLSGLVLGVGLMEAIAGLVASSQATSSGGGDSIPFHDPTVSLGVALLAMAIILLSGVVAGLLPALKALSVQAIDAIREE